MPNELKDSSRIGDQERVFRVFLENKAQTLLLMCVGVIGICSWWVVTLGWLLDLWLVKEHQVLYTQFDQVLVLIACWLICIDQHSWSFVLFCSGLSCLIFSRQWSVSHQIVLRGLI